MSRERTILDAATEVIHERGFHGAGMDEIGRRAGLSGPALYRHFSGKDEILAALLNEAMDELLQATVPGGSDPWTELRRMIRHHVDFAVHRRHLVNVYQREDRSLVDPWRRKFSRRRREYIGAWERAVAAVLPAAAADEITVTTQALLGTAFSVAFWPMPVVRLGDPADAIIALAGGALQQMSVD